MSVKSRFLAILTVLTLFAVAATAPRGNVQAEEGTAEPVPTLGKYQLEALESGEVINLNEPASYIIQLQDPALASYRGGVAGLAATNPAANGTNKIENNAATAAYLDYLAGVQASFLNSVNASLGRAVDVKFTYRHAFNGLAIIITPAEADKIAAMDGVEMVTRTTVEDILTDVGPAWIGAPGIWDGSGAPAGLSTQGEGVVVAILDTGVNSLHPSFAAVGGDGYVHTNPLTYYLGVCDPNNPDYQPSFVCNDKLIGVHDFIDGDGNDPNSPEDGDGHGSHTGSTVAGNVVTATLFAPTAAITDTISGVAPHANVIAYDVCLNGPSDQGGGCPGDALLAAVNQVIADDLVLPNGVAVINYSISGGVNPYGDPVELAFLAATDAGIFVSASAGNAGPGAGTVAHVSPWVATIAASTHNRNILNNVINLTSDGPALGDITGVGFTAGYGPAEIVYAGDFPGSGTPNLCGAGAAGSNTSPWPAGTFNGEIVICDRGTYGRVEKGINVLAAGAGGMILADEGSGLVSDAHALPATHISQADGVTLKAWVAANTNTQGTITGSIMDYDASNGDVMAGFSSRGPVGAFGVLKPDVTAPGVSIWAAVNDDGSGPADYGFLSGTSMSSPHNAGAAALMAALYPTWTPHQIKSALMLTADNVDNFKEDGTTPADPFDLGAGRIHVGAASNVGFVLNETTENFEDADPTLNGGLETALQALNVASLANANCVGGCSWTRTVQSVLSVSADYTVTATSPAGITITVTPANFTLAAGGTQVLTIEADVSGAATGDWQFASIDFETDATVPALTASSAPMATSVFTSTPAVAVPDDTYAGTLATMACNTIDASAIPAGDLITDVTVQVAASHTWVGDFTYKLQAPSSQILALVERPQGDGATNPVGDNGSDLAFGDSSNMAIAFPLTFNDVYTTNPEQMGVGIASAGVVCQNDGRCNFFPNPDQALVAGNSVANFAALDGGPASGNWQLCLGDSGGGDVGTFQEWVLTIEHEAPSGGFVDVADASMPIALIPATGNIPGAIDVETRRDADSYTLNDLEAVEIVDSQVTMYGPAEADQHTFELLVDPSNGAPYDNLDQVYWTTVDVPAGSKRLVAEILDSTSLDLDLYWGTGSTPSAGTEIGMSATGAVLEYLSANDPAAGTYWVLVQNWQASGPGVADPIRLAVGIVPNTDSGLAWFDMPNSVPAGDPFSATLYWDLPGAEQWDAFYGVMDLGTDVGNTDDLGTVDIDITRIEDDVAKEASTAYALPGDVVTYTLTVAANVGVDPLTYTLTDTIPAGMTYVPDSVTGGAVVNGDTVTWSGTQNPAIRDYVYTTSLTDPSCAMPFANSGAYVNLAAFGINPQASLFGDTVAFTWTTSGAAPIQFYGQEVGNAINFTDDGFLFFAPGVSPADPWVNRPIPTASEPNNLLAMFWQDMEIVYAAGARGVSLANLSSGGIPVSHVLEIDDIQVFGEPTQTYDMQTFIARYADDTPGEYEIRFAYDNIVGALITGTIGLENATGTAGLQYAFNDANIAGLQNGMAICFDWVLPSGAGDHVITYAATVDGDVAMGATITNVVDHEVDKLGTKVEQSDATVMIGSGDARLRVAHLAPFAAGAGTAVTVTLNGTPILTDIEFGDSTTYLTVPAGDHDVAIYVGVSGTPAVAGTVTLATDMDYSAVAVGGANSWPVELNLYMDDNTAPAAGMAHVRFGHLAPFTAVITDTLADIRTDSGTVVVDDVPYDTLAGYMPLATGEYDLQVTSADGSVVYMDLAPFTLADGDILYAVAVGDGANQDLGVFAWFTDQTGVLLPLETPVSYGVELYAMAMAITDTIGSTVTYTVHITNTGDMTDTFDLSATGTWTTTASATIELGAGEMGWFYVTVEIPADADAGDSDMATVTATSQGDAAATASLMLTTTAEAEPVPANPVIYLPLIMKP